MQLLKLTTNSVQPYVTCTRLCATALNTSLDTPAKSRTYS